MKNIFAVILAPTLAVVGFCAVQQNAQAVLINVDTILADNPAGLSASVDMAVSGSVLTITLRNTSTGGASGAGGLLTGLGFALPSNYRIWGGGVYVPLTGPDASSVVNNINSIATFSNNGILWGNISGEWGFNNTASGHFSGLDVNRQVSAMQADTRAKFSPVPVDPPVVLDGPEYGLMRDGGNPGGLAAVMDTVMITLNLSAPISDAAAFLSEIDGKLVAVTFGSPSGGGTSVPDGGATLLLFGAGLTALGLVSRRYKKV